MAEWRYISDEEFGAASEESESRRHAPVAAPGHDSLGIYEALGGTVTRAGESIEVPTGWVVKVLDAPVDAHWCYNVDRMSVLMHGMPSELAQGTPVAVFPKSYLEQTSERSAAGRI